MSGLTPEKARIELARRRFLDFARFVDPRYEANWHHEVFADVIERVYRGETRFVILDAPPRHGKSYHFNQLAPAWFLGAKPGVQIITATYSQDFANMHSRKVQAIMREEEYKKVFPEAEIGWARNVRTSYQEFVVRNGSSLKAAGVGGSVTGRGANLFIIDDPFKDRKEAESEAARNARYDWYLDVADSRLEWPWAIIVMATRWHEDDLSGRLLSSATSDKWEHIHLPFIQDSDDPPDYDPRELGEPLWPARHQLGGPELTDEEARKIDIERAEQMKADNAYGFSALWQGNPTPRDGTIFKREWFQHYDAPPRVMAKGCPTLLISVDATFKKTSNADSVSMVVVGYRGGNAFVLDERFGKMDYVTTKRTLKALARKWPRATIVIEEKANGAALISDLKSEIPRVIGFDPRDTKEMRAQLAADWFEADRIRLPSPNDAPWVADWIEDFVGFGARRYDDRVDSLSQALIRLDRNRNARSRLLRVVRG